MIVLSLCDMGPGGVQSIVIRVSEELASRGIPCMVLDTPWGFVWNTLKKRGDSSVRLINIEGRHNLDGIVAEHDTVVASGGGQVLLYASSFKRSNPRVLIWDLTGYESWDGFLRGGRPRWLLESAAMRRWRARLIHEIAVRNGVAFVTELCQSSFTKIASSATGAGTIVPVPVPLLNPPRIRAISPGQIIRAVYIGRAEPWKVAPAKRIIQDFLRDTRVRLTVVTNSSEKFHEILGSGLNDIDFVGPLTEHELEAFLLAEADVCFGMGTACLEGARLGIPSILCDMTLDGSEFPPSYGYRWLFEEQGFCLGRDVGGMVAVPGTSSDKVLEQLRSSSIALGNSCWNVVRDKFEVSHVVDRLLKASQETRLTISQFRDNPGVRLSQAKRRLMRWVRGTRGLEMPLRDPD